MFIGESSSPRVHSSDFHFTRTTKHQPTRNLHSSTQQFAVMASHFHAYMYLSATCKICEYSRGKWRLFIIFDHLHSKFVDCIIKHLFCMKFFGYCGFPNIFIDMTTYGIPEQLSRKLSVMMPRPWLRLLPTFKAWLLSSRSFRFNGEGISTLWRVSK